VLEVYSLSYPLGVGNYSRILLTYRRSMLSHDVIACTPSTKLQYMWLGGYSLLYLVNTLLLACVVVSRKTMRRSDRGNRYVLGLYDNTIMPLDDHMILLMPANKF